MLLFPPWIEEAPGVWPVGGPISAPPLPGPGSTDVPVRVLLVLGGNVPPSPVVLRRLAGLVAVRVGVDGGTRFLLEAGLPVSAAVGDFDSLPASCLDQIGEAARFHDPGQNDTDGEKALRFVADRWPGAELVILGEAGERLDHFLGTLLAACRLAARFSALVFRTTTQWLIPIPPDQEVFLPPRPPGTLVSLIPLGEVRRVTISGLEWPLTEETLSFTSRGVSNRTARDTVGIRCSGPGHLVVVVPGRS
jgi:thiamine pyrophosphokinase